MNTIKSKSFTFLVLILIVSTTILLFFMWNNLNSSIEKLAINQIEETSEKFRYRLDSYFEQIRRDILVTKELADNQFLEVKFDTKMNHLLFPIFNASPQIATFAIASSDGYEFSLLKEDSTFLNNLVYQTDSGINIYREKWQGDYNNRKILKVWTDTKSGYDPRTRPWFKGAENVKDSKRPFWSQPYKNYFHNWPGITVSMKSKSSVPNQYNIVQYDVYLTEISEFTKDLSFGKRGKVFILSENCEFIGLPKLDEISNNDSIDKYLMEDFGNIKYEPLKIAVSKWNIKNEIDSVLLFSYESLNEKWWASLSKYKLDNDRYFIMGVIVPEADFLSDIKHSRNIIVSSGVVFLFFIIVVALGFFDKLKANKILTLQKFDIENKKHIIEEKHKEITDSINYAERIQRSFLASKDLLDHHLSPSPFGGGAAGGGGGGGYFVFFQPKDVVSGDFYWASQLKNSNFAFCCADSTGHGVPGAIMSILNISSLEKAIETATEPHHILGKTRELIIERLKKDGSSEGGKDGMDCSLLVLNQDKTLLTFASANNPVFIVRSVTSSGISQLADGVSRSETKELVEAKPDKMPVGKHDKDQTPFTLQTVQLQKGDVIYTLTDGMPDQFGGEKGKKYMIKNLKNLFLSIAHLPMAEQHTKLEEEFINWKGENEQVDDLCIIGVRI
jgi:hypothetical protein